ncbi:hypothetical protein ACIQOU_09810 [Streptomyces sp. NPDC091279]|uniref:hypothetical protein n=1 Tax=unclassified Streptomyces TaxID=2593676 RepID=UPI00380B7E36
MSPNNTAAQPPEPAPLPGVLALLAAVIAACPTTPSAHAPWVWVTVVVIVVLALQSKTLKRRLA